MRCSTTLLSYIVSLRRRIVSMETSVEKDVDAAILVFGRWKMTLVAYAYYRHLASTL